MDSNAPRGAVLIVDDYLDVRQATAEVLRLESFDVTEAATGTEGLARLADMDVPCLILLDLGLPDMDGYEFHARARALRRPHAAPVVLLTGRAEALLPPGAVGLLRKPFEFQELLDIVHAHAPARSTAHAETHGPHAESSDFRVLDDSSLLGDEAPTTPVESGGGGPSCGNGLR